MRQLAEGSENGRVVLRAENLWKSYDEGTVAVLKGVDCEVFAGPDGGSVRAFRLRQEHAAASVWRARLARIAGGSR